MSVLFTAFWFCVPAIITGATYLKVSTSEQAIKKETELTDRINYRSQTYSNPRESPSNISQLTNYLFRFFNRLAFAICQRTNGDKGRPLIYDLKDFELLSLTTQHVISPLQLEYEIRKKKKLFGIVFCLMWFDDVTTTTQGQCSQSAATGELGIINQHVEHKLVTKLKLKNNFHLVVPTAYYGSISSVIVAIDEHRLVTIISFF